MAISLENFRKQALNRPKPFIGHEGIGARIKCVEEAARLVIRETVFSQLILVLILYLFGPGLNLMFYFNRIDLLKKPLFVIVAVTFFSLIGWIFGTKYLLRLINDRRIEVSSNGTIVLFESRKSYVRELNEVEIQSHEIYESFYRGEGNLVSNYSIKILLKNEESLVLCTSDSKKNIENIYSQVKKFL